MSMKYVVAAVAASIIAISPAHSQSQADRDRINREADAKSQAAITRSLQQRQIALDKAYRAAQGIDRVLSTATSRVPGGTAAYKGGKALGNIGYGIVKKVKR